MAYSNTVVSRAAFGDESSCSLYSNVERGRKLKKVLTDFVELLGTEPMGELLPWLGWVDTLRGMEGKIGSRSLLLRHLSVAVAPSSSAASLRPTAALREALWGPRWMSSEEAKGSFLDKAKVTERIVKVVRNFQKIDDPAKVLLAAACPLFPFSYWSNRIEEWIAVRFGLNCCCGIVFSMMREE
ncbi:hypothetical protein E2562_023991 [Oryza meyeriana var. granulata]|uniref:Uncharacterized protein n=1 Tax=Oryza meyeriana var. granulata TaxID=110450 RepID=A0A6G1EBC5_9ORYZ|nr:hypothetical protein E2562_023991 [Oryza meyeriana var. granulata]KAF0922038.1 hypothetical protein E2562_023991 [Oryza meyeriana var. granulata]KAF0922039.1 hypothetical protein E2562_023991 [Oryza meyeriana var. granulata]